MPSVLKSGLAPIVYKMLTKRLVYHAVFWLILLVLLMLFSDSSQGFWFTLSNELINIFFYGIVVYFNLLYLIPEYLKRKKFITYVILLAIFCIILTPLKVIFFYFKFSNQPEIQATLVANQNIYFLSTFLIGGTSTIFNIITDWVRQLKEKQDLEKETMQSELKFLKSQINPHFLFNTLNNLYALTIKKSDKAPEIVIKLSEMMRYMLYECNEKYVPLSKEINYLKNYLDLEKLRQGSHVELSLEVEGQVSQQRIAPLLFLTFLENCFKHGLSHQLDHGYVHVKITSEGDWVKFYVENSKPDGLPNQEHRRPGGIGLVNVRRRLDILYPGRYELVIDDNPNSYAVNLKIHLD